MADGTPIVAALSPTGVEVEAGKTYHWCQCGRSQNQPFCDGSHAGTGMTPLAFTAEATETAYLCRCKASGNKPFCDGSHAKLGDGVAVGDPVPAAGAGQQAATDSAPRASATPEEPTVERIHAMAKHGLSGHHGDMVAMGVPRSELPHWDDIQLLTAQLATRPLQESVAVATELVIGPRAAKPLVMDIPLFVSDMSFGALSEEAKVSLSRGAEMAGTGICSGEGGSLPEERAANSRYLLELGSAKFGWSWELLDEVQAFHFKAGQGAKTGTGGHLPGSKVQGKIAEVRGLAEGQDAVSPPTFDTPSTVEEFREFGDQVRARTGGIPVGFKMSAQHIEQDIDFALAAGADYIILDGRGGGTGAAPALFRDHISVPTIPALARARRHLDRTVGRDVTLIATGGLRTPEDFIKAMALGADGVAVANSAIQAIGCVAARMCNTNLCPSGIATQKPELRARLDVEVGAVRLATFFGAAVELMQVMARACGHDSLSGFERRDLTTWHRTMADLTGIAYGGAPES
ncbi:MAG: glutamate synthase domain-containing protein 2/CDGSH-type Zn-finger protein [Nitriliruptoraceae bacterium]|jgi:glutamate synthase domain-containing protein 2/CDGSH-type Zn-finger protein